MEFQARTRNRTEALKVDRISGKGCGLIVMKTIKKGELIEAAPTCGFPPEHRKTIDKTELSKYCFVKPSEYNDAETPAPGYIVFGLSSFCNHSEKPNAEVKWVEDDLGQWACLTALRDINPGEEVTMYYANIDEYSF